MDQNPKQQVVEHIKQASNVLITVSANPSVDQLSAALGFTLMLNKLGKHSTAVVSGNIPPAISFLEPKKTFTNSVDGLRDFIIALDKDKADKLRYKVEGDAVRIFITPYTGEITKDDLEFSQGDFNVDVVVALGVSKREDLDNAIKSHGRILHDATVLTINAASQKSDLGAVDWQDVSAGSLSEMLVSISEAFQGGLLDSQIATAFLTGIVAATERFSNNKTSPKVMTMAAQLMAAGANQQLIADHLNIQPASATQKPVVSETTAEGDSSELKLDHQDKQSSYAPTTNAPTPPNSPLPVNPASLTAPSTSAPTPPPPQPPPIPASPAPQNVVSSAQPPANEPQVPPTLPAKPNDSPPGGKTLSEIEAEIAELASPSAPKGQPNSQPAQAGRTILPTQPPTKPNLPQISKASQPRLPDEALPLSQVANQTTVNAPKPQIGSVKGLGPIDAADKPQMGGTFNATSNDAHDAAERERNKDVNASILNHGQATTPPPLATPTTLPSTPPIASTMPSPSTPKSSSAPHLPVAPPPVPPTNNSPQDDSKDEPEPDPNAGVINVDDARKAVEDAMTHQAFDPANHPTASIGAVPLPSVSPTSPAVGTAPNPIASPAGVNPPIPPDTQTLSIPGVSSPAQPGSVAIPNRNADSMPPTPQPPGL